MMRDYSKRYSSLTTGKQKVAGRKYARFNDNNKFLKIIGIVVTVAMIFGVSASVWLGWLVRIGLDELSKNQKTSQELTILNNGLVAQRNRLLAREKIEVAAKELGLYPPAPKQIRRP